MLKVLDTKGSFVTIKKNESIIYEIIDDNQTLKIEGSCY